MLLGARQFFGRRGAPTPPLPYDAEVEYVYIGDRGFFTTPIKHSSRVSLSAQFMAMSQLTGIVGNHSSGVGVRVLSTVAARYGSANVQTSVGSGNFKTDVTLENGIFNVNGTDYSFTKNDFSLDSYITIGQPPDNTVIQARTTIYGVQISDGSVTVNAIPVRIGQGGYFYDTVSKSLLERSSIGTFTPGPDKS